MTRRLGKGDSQRGRARLALGVVTVITAALLLGLTPGGSLLPLFAAPPGGSPTSTATKSTAPPAGSTPTAGGAPSIQLINPSAYESTQVISDKQDANATYHVVASAINAPADADVQFEFVATTGTPPESKTIPGVRIGTSDVWESQWVVDVTDGSYTLTARLVSNSSTPGTLATDTASVTVDNDANGNTREALEITYPTNGGPLGTYDPSSTVASDRNFIMELKTSDGANDVDVFYSTAPPGTEPNWRQCTRTVTISYSGHERQIGCTTASNVGPADITSVAAVTHRPVAFNPTNPTCPGLDPGPPPTCADAIDSGDAHRVTAYDQIPTSISLNPFSSNNPVNSCREIIATVLDNKDVPRPIYGANVDVHATGPLDNTKFGKSPTASAFKKPDAGGHDIDEQVANCGTAPAAADQESVHIHATTADNKHIESLNGTDPNGEFRFAVRSPDQGTTNISAWVDLVDDDFGQNDPTGTATITWGPPQSPSGSVTSGATGSATSSATGSATATKTSTSSASSSTSQSSRTITLEASTNKTRFGRHVTLSGVIESSNSSCESGQTVKIQRQLAGGDFADFGTATSTSGGGYSFEFTADENATYRATVDASASCSSATSSTEAVLVRAKVKLTASDHNVKRGKTVAFHIHVNPCGNHAGTDVVLLRNTGHGFKEIGRVALKGNCTATLHRKAKADANYKARWPSQDSNHETGNSRKTKVNVTNDRDG